MLICANFVLILILHAAVLQCDGIKWKSWFVLHLFFPVISSTLAGPPPPPYLPPWPPPPLPPPFPFCTSLSLTFSFPVVLRNFILNLPSRYCRSAAARVLRWLTFTGRSTMAKEAVELKESRGVNSPMTSGWLSSRCFCSSRNAPWILMIWMLELSGFFEGHRDLAEADWMVVGFGADVILTKSLN